MAAPRRRRNGTAAASPEHLITTSLTDTKCRACGGATMTGHCDGMRVSLDPKRINPVGEAVALLAGLATYEIDVTARRGREPWHRGVWRLRAPWPTKRFVHPGHDCRRRWPAVCIDTRPVPWAAREPLPDEPPF